MSRPLALLMLATDLLFLAYWVVAGLAEAGFIQLPPDAMYADYRNARVVAWNWSFLPVDLAFSLTGLAAVTAARRGSPIWRPLAILSLAFTATAGGMAVAYWTLLGEFDPGWYLPNLALLLWPMIFLPGLVRDTARSDVTPGS